MQATLRHKGEIHVIRWEPTAQSMADAIWSASNLKLDSAITGRHWEYVLRRMLSTNPEAFANAITWFGTRVLKELRGIEQKKGQ